MDTLWRDLRYAVRMLLRTPGFTVLALAALSLGIGANTAIFSVVNAVLLRPLPYPEPDRLVRIYEKRPGGERTAVSPANFFDWKSQATSLQHLVAMLPVTRILEGAAEPEEVQTVLVSPDFFTLLGVKPLLGRAFQPGDGQPGQPTVVILSESLWRRRFDADRAIVGRPVTLGRSTYTIAGVAPAGFRFPEDRTEIWIPLAPSPADPHTRASHVLGALGRLKAGASLPQAQAEMDTVMRRLEQLWPQTNTGLRVSLVPLEQDLTGTVRPALMVLFGAVAVVLLVACTNVANLLLARAAVRQREVAVRLALGASRRRLLRQFLMESLLLALAAGALGLLLASWALPALAAVDPGNLPRAKEVTVDGGVLGFTLAVSVLTGLLFGLMPALRASRPDLNTWLKDGAGAQLVRGLGAGALRQLLVVSQVALTLVLLAGAGLLIKSFLLRLQVPLGFNPDGMLTAQVPPRSPAQLEEIIGRLAGLPGVVAAGAGTALTGTAGRGPIEVEGRVLEPEVMADLHVVTPGFLPAMQIKLRSGRLLEARDGAEAPTVAVVNECLARRIFPGEDPLGKRIRWGDKAWRTIVGVVGDVRGSTVDVEPSPALYMSHFQESWGVSQVLSAQWVDPRLARIKVGQRPSNPAYIVVRTAGRPETLAAAVRQELRTAAPQTPVIRISPMRQLLDAALALPRFYMVLVSAFAALALVLALIGVYGVMSYTVAQRTHEIGLRMALGAAAGDVLGLLAAQALKLTLAGVVLGAAGAWALTRLLASLLFRVRPTDPSVLALVALLLAAVSLIAAWIPARRAARVDPLIALHYE